MRETACFSMYSDISIWMRDSWSPKMRSAKILAKCVLPTPVGPKNIKEPMGLLGSFRSARDRRKAFATTSVAKS